MRLNEISGEDENYMKSAGIKYKFERELREIDINIIAIRNSPPPISTRIYDASVGRTIKMIKKFLDACKITHVPEDDPDIVRAKEIQNELLKIKRP